MPSWIVDGITLDNPAKGWTVSGETQPPMSASRYAASLGLTRLDGGVHSPQAWGNGTASIHVDVLGATASATEASVRELTGILARARSLTFIDGSSRTVDVIRSVVSEPDREAPIFTRVTAQFTLAPFWREGTTGSSAALVPPGILTFTRWAGLTGDIVDGVVRVKGPWTANMAVTDPVDGTGFIYTGTALSASSYLYVDVRTFRAWRTTSASAWTGGSNLVALDYPPAGPLRLTPSAGGLVLDVSGDGFTSDSSVVVRGSRWWL